ncbi:MAG: sigma 54-interacting transcriptional regulator, partial [Bdellovibrionota bacterium]
KLYLSAKYLNEILLKKIEEKERELDERKHGMRISDSFKVTEKEIIGKCELMQNLLKMADKASLSESSVLLTGEAGTGKEIIAKRIHCRSRRKNGPFVVFDCSSYNEHEMEAELFGVTSSDSFTHRHDKLGMLELANEGTLLIKKISKLSLTIQAKLINFINEGIAQRVGEKIPYRSDVRLIVSSSDDLTQLSEQGLFRNDLFYSIGRINFSVPAVRDRKDDIELFAYHFLNKDKKNEEMKSLSPCVISVLKEYKWPGNLRELQNVIERAYILAEGMIVDKNHLSDHICKKEEVKEEKVDKFLNFKEVTLEDLEKAHICNTLEFLGGNKTKTAKLLGITVKTLYNKLHSYGMIGEEKELCY